MIDDRGTHTVGGTQRRARRILASVGRLTPRGSERGTGNRQSILPSIDFIRVDRFIHRL